MRRSVADEAGGVSEVPVTNGPIVTKAISFFTMRDGPILPLAE